MMSVVAPLPCIGQLGAMGKQYVLGLPNAGRNNEGPGKGVTSDHPCRGSTGNCNSEKGLVPEIGLEPTSLAAGDFESPASTIPPLGPRNKPLALALAAVNAICARWQRYAASANRGGHARGAGA